MPPIRPVERLEKLCGFKIANHLFCVFSSWYKSSNGFKIDADSNYIESESLGNVTLLKLHGLLNDAPQSGEESLIEDCNAREDKYIQQVTSEKNNGRGRCRSGTVSPIPLQYHVIDAVTHWLAREVREHLTSHLAPRFREEVLELLLNIIACKVELPRPKEKLRMYEEDLDFISLLAFLLCVSLKCLLTKGVTSLDLSTISHLVKKWKLLCWGGEIINHDGEDCKCPSFDIFGFSLDIGVSGLKTLKYLKLPHFVYNSFVRKVAYMCPNLEVLILRCSADCANPKYNTPVVTNVEVLYGDSMLCYDGRVRLIPGCKDLVTLALPEGVETLDVTNDAIEMLTYMPNLQYFVGAPMIYVTEEFEEIFEQFPEPPKLTNFHHGAYAKLHWPSFVYEESSLEPNPEYLSRVFSLVKEVGIYAPSEVTEKVLKSFPKAQDITIFTDDFEVHGKYLKNLTSLDINVGYQEEWPILISLSQTSPKLEQLTLRSFALQMDDTFAQNPVFPSLHTLKFLGQNVLQGSALLVFLRGCPSLSTFILSMITDEAGDSQLDEQTLLQAIPMLTGLQKFVYKVQSALRTTDGVPSSLTMQSCLALINSCSHLMHIGQLETWKITKAEINTLQELARGKNWDLEIA
ncbi:hypothetical protein GWK47_048746 [Chionoecetes opilio]|uniref:Uncharacterized protein n=1 Tax=Chionoecetes opilio TaxID=41210 RepID=A0A8J4Y2Q1_CHIOP|nr:hypothetical protein GWK47_048746 [Chionoecetes opilio]